MKKFLLGAAAFLILAIVGIYVFRIPIFHALEGPMTADMFVSEDTDEFDPGLPIRARFPAIRALYNGQEISEVDQFVRDKGAIFIANRSVDW